MAASLLPFIVLATLLLLVAASRLSRAGQLARNLQALVGAQVRVEVWGSALDGPFDVASVSAFGAGLHIHFTRPSGERAALKVAQPGEATVGVDRLLIAQARYVQWERKRRRRPADAQLPAVLIERL